MRVNAEEMIKKFNLKVADIESFEEKLNICDDKEGYSLACGYPVILLYISQCWSLSKELDWQKPLERYVKEAIVQIDDGNDELMRIGSLMFGYSGISLLASELILQGVNFNKVKEAADVKMIQSLNKKIDIAEKRLYEDDVKMEDYDSITGLTTVVRFLLDYPNNESFKKILERILKYLVEFSSYKEIDNVMVPNWKLKGENLFNDWEKIEYKNGAINFSVSHGIGSVLSVLSMAKLKGVEVEGQAIAIEKLVSDYKRFATRTDGRIFWPGEMKYEEYLEGRPSSECLSIRDSWCYGVPGVARVLYLAGKAINDKEAMDLAEEALELMCGKSYEDINISSAIVCHGYAGILASLMAMYKDTGKSIYKTASDDLVNVIEKSYTTDSIFGFFDEVINLETNKVDKYNKINLFEGFVGILLALNNYLDPDKDILNKCLLLG